MKIHVEHGEFEENEIVLRCKEMDSEMLEILALLRQHLGKLIGYQGEEIHLIPFGEVCFAETVDGKTFLYTIDLVLETSQSLSFFQDAHEDKGFLRIGKSQLVNLHHVVKLKSLPNSRIELTLKNEERLIASRHYAQNLKEKLGMLE